MTNKLAALACAVCILGTSAARAGQPSSAPQDIQWVSLPGGTFLMGSGQDDEGPVHRVAIKPFQIAKTLVTNRQYTACVKAGACTPPDPNCEADDYRGGDQPVVCVDWDQAKAFSEWAGGRLPTEAEWEYAARSAGKDYEYPWGNAAADCGKAVVNDGRFGCGRGWAWPVCSKPTGDTEQGLCDMAGETWEWMQDWYHESYNGAPSDGSAWEDGGTSRVLRGGSWHCLPSMARTRGRSSEPPGSRYPNFSFRPAR